MKNKKVGTYFIGWEKCTLEVRDGFGGEYDVCLPGSDIAVITIGLEPNRWEYVLSYLIHEAMELCSMRTYTRYSPSNEMSRDHAAYIFVMDHSQFSECCARSAEFIAAAAPALKKVWDKYKSKKGKK